MAVTTRTRCWPTPSASPVQIPFMNTPLYVGPVSAWFNGADLSRLVGLLVTSPLYYWLASRDSARRRRQVGLKQGDGLSYKAERRWLALRYCSGVWRIIFLKQVMK